MTNEDDLSIDARIDHPRAWARDLAIVGVVSAVPLALFASVPLVTAALAVVLNGALGALIGLAAPRLLHRRVRHIPLVVLVPAAIGLGGLWGAVAGFGAALATGAPWMRLTELAASAGAAQLGWLWMPYTIGMARRGSAWPAVLGACLLAPLVAWVAHLHVTW